MKIRIFAALCSLCFLPIALYADTLESSGSSSLGSYLWILAFGFAITGLAIQAKRVGVSRAIVIIALFPMINFLLIPLSTIVLALLPTKKVSLKTTASQTIAKRTVK